jgi:hypothetical protein
VRVRSRDPRLGTCEKIGERQKPARAVILSKAKNLALSSFAISHFHRQSEILRFAQDDTEGLRMTGWLISSQLLAPWATRRRPSADGLLS